MHHARSAPDRRATILRRQGQTEGGGFGARSQPCERCHVALRRVEGARRSDERPRRLRAAARRHRRRARRARPPAGSSASARARLIDRLRAASATARPIGRRERGLVVRRGATCPGHRRPAAAVSLASREALRPRRRRPGQRQPSASSARLRAAVAADASRISSPCAARARPQPGRRPAARSGHRRSASDRRAEAEPDSSQTASRRA